MKTSLYKILLVVVFVVLVPITAFAEQDLGAHERMPIEVSADQLQLDDNAGLMVFTGNAVAEQAGVTIHGHRLTVKYRGENRDIVEVVAEGDVKILQEDRVATGDKAVFYRNEGRVVLTGDPKVTQGDNFVQGQEITIFLNDRRSIVSGGEGGRVNAVFTPGPEDKP